MGPDTGIRPPGTHRRTRLRMRRRVQRRRLVAGAAVLVCVAADIWAVSWAGAREPEAQPSRLGAAVVLGLTEGTRPAVPLDQVEQVPDVSAPTTPGTPGTASGTPGTSAAASVVEAGNGRFTVVPVPVPVPSPSRTVRATGRPVRYSVEVEGGLGIDPSTVAAKVASVLLDPRGWQTKDHVRFVAVSPAQARAGGVDLRITLASPDTTDRLCAPLETRGQVSCHNRGRVVLNSRRWLLGATAYGSDLDGYRTYLVNHEVGHGIGHDHAYCTGAGKPAPVMMQQTYGLKGCTAWPWPTAPSA